MNISLKKRELIAAIKDGKLFTVDSKYMIEFRQLLLSGVIHIVDDKVEFTDHGRKVLRKLIT